AEATAIPTAAAIALRVMSDTPLLRLRPGYRAERLSPPDFGPSKTISTNDKMPSPLLEATAGGAVTTASASEPAEDGWRLAGHENSFAYSCAEGSRSNEARFSESGLP